MHRDLRAQVLVAEIGVIEVVDILRGGWSWRGTPGAQPNNIGRYRPLAETDVPSTELGNGAFGGPGVCRLR